MHIFPNDAPDVISIYPNVHEKNWEHICLLAKWLMFFAVFVIKIQLRSQKREKISAWIWKWI